MCTDVEVTQWVKCAWWGTRRKAGGVMGTEKGLVCHLKEFALDPIGSRGLQ